MALVTKYFFSVDLNKTSFRFSFSFKMSKNRNSFGIGWPHEWIDVDYVRTKYEKDCLELAPFVAGYLKILVASSSSLVPKEVENMIMFLCDLMHAACLCADFSVVRNIHYKVLDDFIDGKTSWSDTPYLENTKTKMFEILMKDLELIEVKEEESSFELYEKDASLDYGEDIDAKDDDSNSISNSSDLVTVFDNDKDVETIDTSDDRVNLRKSPVCVEAEAESNVSNKKICPHCNKPICPTFLKKHIMWVHNKVKSRCEKCDAVVCNLKRHLRIVHKVTNNNGIKNEDSSDKDNSSADFFNRVKEKRNYTFRLSDLERVQEGKKVKCPICKKAFCPSFIYRHIRWIHEKSKEVCPKCNASVCNLTRHFNEVHQNIRNHICEVCGHRCLTAYELKYHIKLKHEGHREVCQTCNKSFVNLSNHIRTVHNKELDFACDKCEMRFSCMRNLNRHIESIHSGKKLKNGRPCNICSRRVIDMNKHLNTIHPK